MATGIVKAMVDNLPAGLDRACLRVLSFHVGREKAISRHDFMEALKGCGFALSDDRTMRLEIHQLRQRGFMICSSGGVDGGYWMAANWPELSEFLEREYHAKAMDMLETEAALRKAGEFEWGAQSKQIGLFS